MVSKSEDWWEGNFQKYSIRRYNSMSIYLKFKKCSQPFSRGDHNFREAYWRDENCFIYEWYDRTQQKGEKFGIDHNSSTYFYENWFLEESIHIVIKSWLCGTVEWGVLIKYFPDHEESQSWSLDGENRTIESKTVFPEKTESVKSGKRLTAAGLEDFTEKFWQTSESSGKEVAWKRGKATGEEKVYKGKEEAWGELWEEDGENFKKSNWKEEGGKNWGEESGKEGMEEWEKRWEKDPENEFEEIRFVKGEKEWGNERSRSNQGRYVLEWEGDKPEIVTEEKKSGEKGISKPKARKLRSGRGPESGERGRTSPGESDKKLQALEAAMNSTLEQLAQKEAENLEKLAEKEAERLEQLAQKDAELLQQLEKKDAEIIQQLAEKEAERLSQLAQKESELLQQLAEKDAEALQQLADKEAERLSQLAEKEAERLSQLAQKDAELLQQLAKKDAEALQQLSQKESERLSQLAQKESEKIDQLKTLFESLKQDLTIRVSDLESFSNTPESSSHLISLKSSIENSKPSESTEALLEAIDSLRKLSSEINTFDTFLLNSFPDSFQIEKAFQNLTSTTASLHSLMDPTNQSDLKNELSRLQREFEFQQAPKEKFLTLTQVNPLLRGLINFQSRTAAEFDRKTAEITELLSKTLRDFEEVIKESQDTLAKVRKVLHESDEASGMIESAYSERGRKLINDIETLVPYTTTLPQLSDLLRDMEKFKRELLDTSIPQTLQNLTKTQTVLTEELLTGLKQPVPETLFSHQPAGIMSALNELQSKLAENQALALKLVGKDSVTGNSAIDSIKPLDQNDKIHIDIKALLRFLWVKGQAEQISAANTLKRLAEAFGSEHDKAQADDFLQKAQTALEGQAPENPQQALEALKTSLEEFLPARCSQSELLDELIQKCEEKAKAGEVKIEQLNDVWLSLMMADKIAEKLVTKDVPQVLEDARKRVDALPDKPEIAVIQKEIIKLQEIAIGMLNADENFTAEELKEMEAAAKKRAGGKAKALQKKGKKALRSGRGGPKRLNISEPATELIQKSLTTTTELALWILGSRPAVVRHIDGLKSSKDPILAAIQQDGGSEEAIDGVLNFLSSLEAEKSALYTKGDIVKNLILIIQKAFRVLESTSSILKIPVPAEAVELNSKSSPGDLSDLIKRIGFFLSIFFKMVKEATGADDEGEHLDDALKSLMQKKVVSLLPFDPIQLLSELKGKNNGDLRRLKFLAGLVGSDEEVKACEKIEKRAIEALHAFEPRDNQEAMQHLDSYLHSFPEIEKKIYDETERMLAELLERLTNPEPLERDVAGLIAAAENLDLAIRKTGTDPEGLTVRKEEIPTQPATLLQYLVDLVNDYSKKNLEVSKPSKEELHKISLAAGKKVKCAPVQLLREIKHFFAGPGVQDTIELVLKLDKATESLLKHGIVNDPTLYESCKEGVKKLEKLTPCEIKCLAKDYSDIIIGFVEMSESTFDFSRGVEETTLEIMSRRRETTTISLIPWNEIFKSRGLDLDGALLVESIVQEQDFAKVYIQAFTHALGSAEQKSMSKMLLQRSEEILKIEDEATKIKNYIQLRLEQSRLLQPFAQKEQNLNERLVRLDNDRSGVVKQTLSEVEILVEKNNPGLKSQLQVIADKEQANQAQSLENIIEVLLRLTSRLGLEKELQRIKDEADPADKTEAEMLEKLTELENRLFSGLRALWGSLSELSAEFKPGDFSDLKSKTDPSVSTTVASVFASLLSGLDSLKDFSLSYESLLLDNPSKQSLLSSLDLLKQQSTTDDNETETVFSGLFRLVGSTDDKAKAKKLRESRLLVPKELSRTVDLAVQLSSHLEKFLPVRTAQSAMQSKLIKATGDTREGIDDIDLSTEDIMNKALREVANSIMPEDTRSKGTLDGIRKAVEAVNEISATNIPETVERVTKRLENWEKLERLRRELREKLSKEINRLKGDVQDKANELHTAKATLEGVRTQYEAQLTMLQNTAEQHASLIEKLTQEAIDKEKDLSAWKNKNSDLTNLCESQKEDLEKLQDEIDSNSKELRNLRRSAKEKDSRIRDLEENLEGLERSTERSSLSDKEKSEVFTKLKEEIKQAREELAVKGKSLDETEENLSKVEREKQKLEIEFESKGKELEAVRKERANLKAELLKMETEKSEMLEKSKLNKGGSVEEIKQLERILEDKQQQLEESESNLAVAKRYQLLYLEISEEKRETEETQRQLDIQNTDLKRKIEEIKQENDQLKYKTRAADQAQKDFSALQKEFQKLQMRLEFFEKSGESAQDTSLLAKKLSDEIVSKESQIELLNEEIQKLTQKIQFNIEKHNKSLSRSFLVRLCHAFKEQEGLAYRRWKVYKKLAPTSFSISHPGLENLHTEEERDNEDDFKVADRLVREESAELAKTNPILALYQGVENKGDKTISYVSFFKFMEEVMDKKFEVDKKDLAEFKPMKSLPEFLPQYLTKTLGIQSLALKFLCQLVPTLHNLCAEGHAYAIFYARMMNLFHPDPISYALGIYLVRIRMEFQPLLDKYDRSNTEHTKKGDEKMNLSKNAYEQAGSGGMALLTDVIELVYKLFTGDREGGLKALELLKPSKISHEDFVAFKICHKMAKLGKTPEMIFKMLDKDAGGTIDTNEFITGTKDDLDLWISDENVQKLMMQLDIEGKGEISKESFFGKISMKALMQWNKDPNFAVSKASFLTALADVHKFKLRKLAAKLNQDFRRYAKDGIDLNEFGEVICRIEPSLSKMDLEKLFIEAGGRDKGVVGIKGMVWVGNKYGFGDVKSFKVRELMQQLTRSKSFVGAILGGMTTTVEEEVVIKKRVANSFLFKK